MTADDQRRRVFPIPRRMERPAGRRPAGDAASSGPCSSPRR